MIKTTLAGLRARTARMVLSSIAIVLGVAFISGTLIIGNALDASIHNDFARQARGVDVSVRPQGHTPAFTEDTVERIRELPGVAAADGRTAVLVPLVGTDGRAKPVEVSSLEDAASLREFDIVDGQFPRQANEIAVEAGSARTLKLSIGHKVTVLDKDDKSVPMTVVGTYSQGASAFALSGDHAVMPASAMLSLTDVTGFDQIVATAAAGTSEQQVADRVRAALAGSDVKVQTGAQLTTETLEQAGQGSTALTQFMLVFALIALIVASMVIYNTFTILVAQRSRELALLRCVGAHRGQVFRGVLFEAFVIGVIASVVGLGVGVGLAALVQSAAGAATGATGPVLVPVTLGVVFAAFAVGVLVTMASAMMPALRASRVAPLAALRSLFDSHDEIKRTSVARLVFVAALAVTGVGICVLGAHGGATGFVATGIGTMVLLAAAIVLGPVIVGPLVRMLGTLPGLLFGVPAKLAAVNAGRNPKRTAATTAALMIGVTVVTMVTVVATSAKQSVNAEIDKQFSADYTVTSSVPGHRLPTALAGQLGRLDEVDSVRSTAHAVVTLGADDHEIVTATDSGATGLAATVVEGDLGRLSTDTIALSTTVAKGSGAKVGDEVRASSASGGGRLRVVALFDAGADRVGQSLSALVTLDTLARLAPTEAGYDAITVKVKPGVTPEAGQAAVESAVRSVPIADVSSATATKTELGTVVDRLLALVWALVGLAVVIALFGIANTMSLSVLERTGESALLRALGLTRGQLRLMLLVESVLMGLLGAVVGVLLGGGFARLLVVALSSDQFRFAYAVPYGQIAMMLGAAVVAAILAAVLPARKAARSSVVTGMAQV